MSLLDIFLNISEGWSLVLKQNRVFCRAIRQSLSTICTHGRRTISQTISFSGHDHEDWSADYRFFSKRVWDESDIFMPVLQTALGLVHGQVIPVAFDDTRIRKTGKKIQSARWGYDPQSPPFHPNLFWGTRNLQASVLVPFHQSDSNSPARGIPVRFTEIPHVQKPGKRASKQDWDEYRVESKAHNLSHGFVSSAQDLRQDIDKQGYADKHLLIVGDGSFCNRTCFQAKYDRTTLLARARKDASLCFQNTASSRRYYSHEKFTPEQVRKDPSIPWETVSIFHGSKFREVRYKKVTQVLWQRGTRKKELALLVIAPTPYRVSQKKRMYYRQAAYLLCSSNLLSAEILLQSYFDRWEIEVNFRDEKTTMGLGQAQVWVNESVKKQPAFLVASYATLLLAGHIAYGNQRGSEYTPFPKWRRNAKRPSCLDLINCLRKEIALREDIRTQFDLKIAS